MSLYRRRRQGLYDCERNIGFDDRPVAKGTSSATSEGAA